VDDFAFAEVLGLDFPDFFEAEAVGLGLAVPSKVELLNDLLRKRAVAAFSEEGDAGVEFHAALERGLGLSVSSYPHIVGGDPFNGTIVLIQYFTTCEAWVDFHTDLLRPFRQPLGELIETYDVIAVIVHLRRCWQGYRAVLRQEPQLFASR